MDIKTGNQNCYHLPTMMEMNAKENQIDKLTFHIEYRRIWR